MNNKIEEPNLSDFRPTCKTVQTTTISGNSFKTLVKTEFFPDPKHKYEADTASDEVVRTDTQLHLAGHFKNRRAHTDCPTCFDSKNMSKHDLCFDCGNMACTYCSLVVRHSESKRHMYVCARCCISRSDKERAAQQSVAYANLNQEAEFILKRITKGDEK